MNTLLKILLILFFCIEMFNVQSQQISNFSDDPEEFLGELSDMFGKLRVKEDKETGEALMINLTEIWYDGTMTEEVKNDVMDICNQMLDRRFKAFPHFYAYLSDIILILNTGQEYQSYQAWHKSVGLLVADKKSSKPITAYLEASHDLLKSNIIYQSRAIRWVADSAAYTFKFDSVPKVIFQEFDLKCFAHDDSSVIQNTLGMYYPIENRFQGSGGKISWRRAGYDENEVYALLYNYDISLRFSNYEIDTVNFYHKKYWKTPLLGRVEEKILANVSPEKAIYPKFTSYSTYHEIDSLFLDIEYQGGIEIKGAKLVGLGSDISDAVITVKKDKRDFLVIKAKNFVIRPNKFSSSSASVSIRFKQDSIYHPGLQVNYVNDSREFSFVRLGQGLAQSPFYNSFHDIEMYTEAIYWSMNDSKMNFEMTKGISGLGKAVFESSDYFSAGRYDRLQGIDNENPLYTIKRYIDTYNVTEIAVDGLVDFMRKPKNQVISLMLSLAEKGFVIYHPNSETITVKDKLFHYIQAFNKKTDYDVIQFLSETYAYQNATMDLDSFNLKLFGVPNVILSDSQNVFLYPFNEELVLLANRDFVFSGRVRAGMFDLYTSDAYFSYDEFKLDMPFIDSLAFYVKSFTPDVYGRYAYIKVKNVLSDLSGYLLIDHPNNKSGRESYPEYPIFTSNEDAYVYYDKPSIQRGSYTRDNFYFYVYPFTIDSLDNFKTDHLKFNGYLASADIFPDIEETLMVQPDYSLGFVTSTPPSGYPAYLGKGVFYNEIRLSNKGLWGDGSLEYLTSTTWSDNFLFLPFEMQDVAQNFTIREQIDPVEYPSVTGLSVEQKWKPYENKMMVTSTNIPFSMFNDQADLSGGLVLTPEGLQGGGTVNLEDAELNAKMYDFKQHEIFSDTADFSLKSLASNQLAFATKNYQLHIDLDLREGEFFSNGGMSVADFPVNRYISLIDRFQWKMDDYEIAMGYPEKLADMRKYDTYTTRALIDVDLEGSEFISTHPDQDSLRFVSTIASFNLKDNIIEAKDVKYIRVADAAIFPDDKKVTILPDAKINTFNDAKILANTVTKYHEMYNADVEIESRSKYDAIGDYDYVDATGYKQKIKLKEIGVDRSLNTFASGNIEARDGFMLSSNFDYMGKVEIFSRDEFLTFDGGFRIRHTCNPGTRQWVQFKSKIDPEDIYLRVSDTLRNLVNDTIYSALLLSNEYNRFYSGFLNPMRHPDDQVILTANGFINFDPSMDYYRIGSFEKLKGTSLEGNQLTLDRRQCILKGEGEMNLGADFRWMDVVSFGQVNHYIIPDSTSFDLVLGFDFPFDVKALDMIADEVSGKSLNGVALNRPIFIKALTDIVGGKKAERLISDIQLFNRMKKLPEEMEHTILLTDVKMKWNFATRSYISYGPIGVGAFGDRLINRYFTGYVEVAKKKTGDVVNIYIEFENSRYWYYFNYRDNILQTISANTEYNNLIMETKEEKRTIKGEKKEEDYMYMISDLRKKVDFLRRMR